MKDAAFGAAALGAATPGNTADAKAPVTNDTKQLALRAIFGVSHELNEGEIIQRARTLPGVRNLAKVRPNEMVALETLRNCISKLGFGDREAITMTCPGGVIDFVAHGDTSMAVIHEGEYAPGVRETLLIVVNEIDQL
ncbi:MAG: hypothetical protein HKN82_07600 [Akkermansiaceae bacterium]|nr:hypothetical protein [Akkermansiaceae bacterium]NNM28535.1 hypothetical protein [Akkermansiaceae bacterium]